MGSSWQLRRGGLLLEGTPANLSPPGPSPSSLHSLLFPFLSSSQLWLKSRQRASWGGGGCVHMGVCVHCAACMCVRGCMHACAFRHICTCVLCPHVCVRAAEARRGFELLSRCRSVSAADKQPGSRAALRAAAAADQSCWQRGELSPAAPLQQPTEGGRGRAGGREGKSICFSP